MRCRVLYFASLRDRAGCAQEDIVADTVDASALYAHLRKQHGFSMGEDALRVAINGEFSDWRRILNDGDEVVFIPPVSGG